MKGTSGAGKKKKKGRPGVRGAKGGKLAPGAWGGAGRVWVEQGGVGLRWPALLSQLHSRAYPLGALGATSCTSFPGPLTTMLPPPCPPTPPARAGEKKLIKRERREAKRAARAAARGFDLAWANRQLEEFVAREGDAQVRPPLAALPLLHAILPLRWRPAAACLPAARCRHAPASHPLPNCAQAFGPYGKHECRAVQRLAALYGCRATLQGSKPNRKLVVVRRCSACCCCAAPTLAWCAAAGSSACCRRAGCFLLLPTVSWWRAALRSFAAAPAAARKHAILTALSLLPIVPRLAGVCHAAHVPAPGRGAAGGGAAAGGAVGSGAQRCRL